MKKLTLIVIILVLISPACNLTGDLLYEIEFSKPDIKWTTFSNV